MKWNGIGNGEMAGKTPTNITQRNIFFLTWIVADGSKLRCDTKQREREREKERKTDRCMRVTGAEVKKVLLIGNICLLLS